MSRLLISGVVVLAIALIALLFPGMRLPPLDFQDKIAETAAGVIAGLAAIALILERALAVFVDLLYNEVRNQRQQALNALRLTVPVPPLPAPGATPAVMAAAIKAQADARAALAPALAALAETDIRRERFRLLLGFAIAFIIAAAGVRTLAELVKDTSTIKDWAVAVDIMLTAGLLAGGSNALAKLVELLQEAATRKLTNLRTA